MKIESKAVQEWREALIEAYRRRECQPDYVALTARSEAVIFELELANDSWQSKLAIIENLGQRILDLQKQLDDSRNRLSSVTAECAMLNKYIDAMQEQEALKGKHE